MTDPQNFHRILALALALLALALILVVVAWLLQAWRRSRSGLAVDRALLQRRVPSVGSPRAEGVHPSAGSILDRLAQVGAGWVAGRFGRVLMADEDRDLVESAGYERGPRAQSLFLLARVAGAVGMMVLAWLWHPSGGSNGVTSNPLLWALIGLGLGWMLPKWVVQRRVKQRLADARAELPLLVDLLRLLQGVGLSVDQSLHIIADEFYEVMPVLTQELGWSLDMYTRGRSREQSLARLSDHFEDDDLAAICKLLCQVDEHGGAVQEPLAHFGERLRDRRKLDLKAQVGKLTVKMTAVMVVTLLPALLIVTGGAGFVAILRGLSQVTS